MTNLQHLSDEVLNLWNKWEIRGMVLLSLLLQIILVIFGSRRKTIARSWILIFVWSAYLSADMVATFALGILARSEGNSSFDGSKKANDSILAFWAPFLVLHLGGPDTITAYSIEDNELWLRHLLGLAIQVIVAFYVFSRSWGSGFLTFIAIPMFIVGIIKYAERTWMLRSSCSKNLKNYFLAIGRILYREVPGPILDSRGSHLHLEADHLSDISMFMMQDLLPGISSLYDSWSIISAYSAKAAFKIVEIELGLIYDRLYTKAPLSHSCRGIILRSISFFSCFTTFVTFAVMIDKQAYSTIDITITYLLLVGALFLEIYAFLCLVFSDWTLIWLSADEGGNAPASRVRPAICSLIGKLTPNKRWSRSMAQHNLISSCIEDEPDKCLELFGIHEMMKQMYVIRKDMTVGLKGFIFEHLKQKGEEIKENFNFVDIKFRSEIIDQRGDGVLERMQQLEHFKWCTTEVEFSHSIIVWHLATDICFYGEEEFGTGEESSERETSKWLSEYMMYLLVNRPNMLPQGFGDLGYSYRHTRQHLVNHLTKENYMGMSIYDKQRKIRKGLVDFGFENIERDFNAYSLPGSYELYEKSALCDGLKLGEQILKIEEPWEMIKEVWIEMLAYAAAHGPWKEHVQQLRRGGELLTHVRFLMLHFGLSQQYQLNRHDDHLWTVRLPEEERLQLELAIQGIEEGRNKDLLLAMLADVNTVEQRLFSLTLQRLIWKRDHHLLHETPDEDVEETKTVLAKREMKLGLQKRELEKAEMKLELQKPELEDEEMKLEHQKRELENQQVKLEHQKQEMILEHKEGELEIQEMELELRKQKLERQKREFEYEYQEFKKKKLEFENKKQELEHNYQELEEMRHLLVAIT